MGRKDPRIDVYIEQAAPWAQPVLKRLRLVIHRAVPGVNETMKWSNPSFEYHGLLAGIAVFKSYCTFGLWKDKLVRVRGGESAARVLDAAGKLASVDDFPDEAALGQYIQLAAQLNEQGVRDVRNKPMPKGPVEIPDDLKKALEKNKKAKKTFEGFSPSNKREYVEWIAEAKQPATRIRRLEQAILWMAEGKVRNWKYVR
jgi:uncharacterized protein YdeI (YjbR/CyaY-like superfamily)